MKIARWSILLGCLVFAGCGSSSTDPSTAGTAGAAAPTTPPPGGAKGGPKGMAPTPGPGAASGDSHVGSKMGGG